MCANYFPPNTNAIIIGNPVNLSQLQTYIKLQKTNRIHLINE